MDNVKNQQSWVTFLSNFESENKDFIVALSSKHPELTKSQFQVCLYLRSGLIERWNTLDEFYTYPNMIPVLKID